MKPFAMGCYAALALMACAAPKPPKPIEHHRWILFTKEELDPDEIIIQFEDDSTKIEGDSK